MAEPKAAARGQDAGVQRPPKVRKSGHRYELQHEWHHHPPVRADPTGALSQIATLGQHLLCESSIGSGAPDSDAGRRRPEANASGADRRDA
eukprot:SAG31_NODE_3036_length_4763_cov_3.456046_6_plen_91_part_00